MTCDTEHPDLSELSDGDTVRVDPADAELFVAEVDDVRPPENGESTHAVTVIEDGYRSPLWDLESLCDPRSGWGEIVAVKRVYLTEETRFVEKGAATVKRIDAGIDPDRLDPGVTVEAVNADRYRVVVPPWEREYDNKALAYNLDSGANVCEKVAPSEVIRRVE